MGTLRLMVKLSAVLLLINGVQSIKMELLDSIMTYQTDQLCELATCIHPAGNWCPDGTRWVEGITAGGCCGGCVRYKQDQDRNCNGKMDSFECTVGDDTVVQFSGYGYCSPMSTKSKSGANYAKFVNSLSSTRTVENGVEVFTSIWCDYGLVCNDFYDPPTCVPNTGVLTCKDTQEAYDSDKAKGLYEVYRDDYRWRPDCDEEDNNYSPKQCKTSFLDSVKQCTCVDPQGESLPGKAFDFQDDLYDEMNCLCSRKRYQLLLEGVTGVTIHCKSNGNYEELQCQDGFCYCVHSLNGTVYGYQMPESGLNYLPCYNRTLVGELYYRFCDSQEVAHNTLVNVMDKKGVRIGPSAPVNCNYDGSFSGYQCTGSKCTCTNKYNKDCNIQGAYGCGCFDDMLTYLEYGKNYGTLVCGNNIGIYNNTQYIDAYFAMYNVDTRDGIRISPVVRSSCYLKEDNYEKCQIYGNDEKVNDEKVEYCTNACPGCSAEAYFYNDNYFASASCSESIVET